MCKFIFQRMLCTLLFLMAFHANLSYGQENYHPCAAEVSYVEVLRNVSVRNFIEDLLGMYWEISELPKDKIPTLLNILAAYSEEPEYALQVIQEHFPDLTKKKSEFYFKYQTARNAKFNTFSRALLQHLKGNVIADIGGEDTRLVDKLISLNPAIEKAFVTDINMIRQSPSNPKVEFLLQPSPHFTTLSRESVDSVILSTMLHHIETPDRIKLLVHICDILKVGGRIVLIEDTFPETPGTVGAMTSLDQRFLAFDYETKIKILAFLDWWGNRLMKNSREIPLPCTFLSMEKWETLMAELGLELVETKYLGIPVMHTHILAPKAILVFEKPPVREAGKDMEKSRREISIARADTNKEMLAFVPQKFVNVNLSIGGSKMQTAVVDSKSEELFRLEEYTWREDMIRETQWDHFTAGEKRAWLAEKILDQITLAIEKLKGIVPDSLEVEGVGISWAGPVKPDGLLLGPNIDGFSFNDLTEEELKRGGIDFASIVKDRIIKRLGNPNWTVSFLNDGDAAAIANFKQAGIDDGILLIFGTGIGSGIVNNAQVFYSVDGFKDRIGEVGHHILYHPKQNRYFYYGVLSRGKILEDTIPTCISTRLAGPGLARKFLTRLQREMGYDEGRVNRYLNESNTSFSELELAALDGNEDLGPILEKKVLSLVSDKANRGDIGAVSFVREVGYELGLGLGVFIKEFENEPFVKNIILSGGLGENFGAGLTDEKGQDLLISQIKKGIEWSLRNHSKEMNEQFLLSLEYPSSNEGSFSTCSQM